MPGTRVFIGRLSDRVRESDIDRFFRDIGKVRDVHLKAGFGFVDFNDPRDADDAVYEMNNKELCGERVTVEMARDHREPRYGRGGGGRGGGGYRGDSYRSGGGFRGGGRFGGGGRPAVIRSKYRVIVENLSSRVSWQDLKSHFRQYAQVVFADINRHRQNEGVVDFATRDDMERAIDKLDQTELNGRVMDLIEDKPPRSPSRRSRSRSRNSRRSRSSSRSRSRSRTPERRRSEKSSNGTRERRESKSSPSRRSSPPPSRSKRSPPPPSKRREASSPEHKRRGSVSPKSPAKRGRNGDSRRDDASSRSRSRSSRSRSRDSTPPRRRRS